MPIVKRFSKICIKCGELFKYSGKSCRVCKKCKPKSYMDELVKICEKRKREAKRLKDTSKA